MFGDPILCMSIEEFWLWFNTKMQEVPSDYREKCAALFLQMKRYELPLFPTNQYASVKYHLGKSVVTYNNVVYSHSSHIKHYVEEIPVEKCIGNTWVYSNDKSYSDEFGIKLMPMLVRDIAKMPTVEAEKVGDYYLCNNGNHRIYAAYLAGRPVKIECEREFREETLAKGDIN